MAKHGFPVGPIPEPDRQDALDRFSHTVPEQLGRRLRAGEVDVSIASLIATQKGVDQDHVEDLMSGREQREAGNAIDVLRVGGKNFIWDGHHASEAARKRGDSSIRARLLDLDTIRGVPTDLLQKVMSIHNDMSEGQRSSKSFQEFMQDAREYAQLTLNRPVTDGEIAIAVSALESEGFISRISFSSPSSADLAAKQSLITANPPSGAGQPITGMSSDSNEIAMPLGNLSVQSSPLSDQSENTQLGNITMQAGAGTRQPITHLDRGISSSPLEQTDIGGVPDAIYNPDDFGLNMELGVYDPVEDLLGELGSIDAKDFEPPVAAIAPPMATFAPPLDNAQGSSGSSSFGRGILDSVKGLGNSVASATINSVSGKVGSSLDLPSSITTELSEKLHDLLGITGDSSASVQDNKNQELIEAINKLTEAITKMMGMMGDEQFGIQPDGTFKPSIVGGVDKIAGGGSQAGAGVRGEEKSTTDKMLEIATGAVMRAAMAAGS